MSFKKVVRTPLTNRPGKKPCLINLQCFLICIPVKSIRYPIIYPLILPKLQAIDLDEGVNAAITYTVLSGNVGSTFVMDVNR